MPWIWPRHVSGIEQDGFGGVALDLFGCRLVKNVPDKFPKWISSIASYGGVRKGGREGGSRGKRERVREGRRENRGKREQREEGEGEGGRE